MSTMDFFKTEHYNSNRFLLLLIGQWPYDNSKFTIIQRIIVIILISTFISVQVSALFTPDCDMDLIAEILPPVLSSVLSAIKYFTYWFNAEAIKKLLEHIKYDWCNLKEGNEANIIKKYARDSRLYTYFYAGIVYGGFITFMVASCVPYLYDFSHSFKNTSRDFKQPFVVEYFVDHRKYVLSILIHLFIGAAAVLTVVVATDVMYICFMQHACGMFSVVGYNLEHAFDVYLKNTHNGIEEFTKSEKLFIRSVGYHKRALGFVDTVNAGYGSSYLVQLILAGVALSVNMYRLTKATILMEDINNIVMYVIHTTGHLLILFLNFYPAQNVIDESVDIFLKAGSGRWYLAPPMQQKWILLVMHRGMKPSVITMGKTFAISLTLFGTLVQTSASYFMTLYSIR